MSASATPRRQRLQAFQVSLLVSVIGGNRLLTADEIRVALDRFVDDGAVRVVYEPTEVTEL